MRCFRSLVQLTRTYSHVIWLAHLAALLTVLTVMVHLHNSTCGLETPPTGLDLGVSDVSLHRAKRHLMAAVDLPHAIATDNGSLPDISRLVTLTPDLAHFLSRPVVHQRDFRYIHNPRDVCRPGSEVKFVVLVPSARYHFDQRRKVRMSTLRRLMLEHPHDAAVVFFLGVPPAELQANSERYQKKIDAEAAQYGDIVQQDYMDTHRTLVTKATAMLQWVNRFCSNAKYVIKLDDDIRFDTSDFLSMVARTAGRRERAILGQVFPRPSAVMRDTGSRYFVSEREFPASHFPPYVMGGLLAFSMATARLLYEGTLRIKTIPLDDVYVTGIVAKALNISLVSDPEFTFEHHSCGAIRL